VNYLSETNSKLKTGTTTVGLITKDAIILAADQKATMGNLTYEEESKKIYKITENTALTNAGVVGDSLVLIRFLQGQALLYETERKTKMTPNAMATLLSNLLNSNRYYPFMVQFLLGGIVEGKKQLFEITLDGGILERKNYGVTGSGTHFALGVLDQEFKENMSVEEGLKLAVKAVLASKRRDIFSGGRSINLVVIDETGVKEIEEKKIEKIINELNVKK